MDDEANNLGQNWCEASTVYGLGDLGTPGAANDECDLDGDGFSISQGDCDDSNPSIHPFAPICASGSGQRVFPAVADSDSEDTLTATPVSDNSLTLWTAFEY